jgi:phosphohistidine phosphatase
MKLYVLRHGEAEEKSDHADDAARRLTPRGKSKMREAALGMRRAGLTFNALLTSPLARAAETAAIVAEIYEDKIKLQELQALATGVNPEEALKALAPFAARQRVMIVGHEPQLGRLASLLASGSTSSLSLDLKKGGCVAIDVEDRFEPDGGKLIWMMTPRQLRKLQ